MKVVFKCATPEFYDYMLNAFKQAKENDNWQLATLKIGRKKARYITCCGNVWFIWKTGDYVLFGYEGTRAGAIRLQPFFPNVLWHKYDPPIIEFVLERKEVVCYDENGVEVGRCRVTAKVRRFELQVVKYRTTTPKKWQLQWYNQVERIPYTNWAVIMSPEYPMKLVRYKNVYLEKATQT
jgi:hypothetical protein